MSTPASWSAIISIPYLCSESITDEFCSPCCPLELQTIHLLVGQTHPQCLTLRAPIPAGTTLRAFQAASTTYIDDDEFHIQLPSLEARVFGQLIRHMNNDPLEDLDTGRQNSETHISQWCILYVLAIQFGLPVLAAETRSWYEDCRRPYWQVAWLPLPAEIRYLAACLIRDCRAHLPWTQSDVNYVERPKSVLSDETIATTELAEEDDEPHEATGEVSAAETAEELERRRRSSSAHVDAWQDHT
ncbi:uncharacterized protein LY89DRAFT_741356 [Mollisia scopiformis]|uniref:BTB domain-containing protein n=1 Tax=Mollisia scopiformis TaxID=149040 RepID=A0A132BAN5_MOLSC|nr:uncharacterized protein LY89DRAFT_741356 [Mollisia scopiformis]KUJ09059.1 hypothetical protein LY89DRAFT_741356 [Mollisia scopiformis]